MPRTRSLRLPGALLATAALFTVAACGDDSGTDETTSAATGTAATTTNEADTASPASTDACDLLTFDEIEGVTGIAPESTSTGIGTLPEGETVCFWKDGDGDSVVTLHRYAPPVDVDAEYEDLQSGLFGTDESADVGEESFFRLAGARDLGGVVFREGEEAYYLLIANPADGPATEEMEADGREQSVELAEDVLARA